jgi:hypothetical protein
MFVDQSRFHLYYMSLRYKCKLTGVYVQNINLRIVMFIMIKNILPSPICGALTTVILFAVIVQVITPFRSVEAQQFLSESQGDNALVSNAAEAMGGLEQFKT